VKQSKVSMVMPCYNKVEYIREMLDSILVQKWNSIELIMVNDGSTDGTREVIAEYEPKIKARDYECAIIDQKNMGCCAALKTGLTAVTGDYVCVVDSDDELNPEYVSVMAGFLDNNNDYDYAFCDYTGYTGSGIDKEFHLFIPQLYGYESADESEQLNLIERFLLNLMPGTGWIYMIRAEYLKTCRIVDNFITDTPGSYEPGFIIPLLAYGGKYRYFPLQLYNFNVDCDGHSKLKKSTDGRYPFQDEYLRLCKKVIRNLSEEIADNVKKSYWIALAAFFRLFMSYDRAVRLDETEIAERYFAEGLEYVKNILGILQRVNNNEYLHKATGGLKFFRPFLLSRKSAAEIPKSKIIGVAAKARRALEVLSFFKDAYPVPVELWDENAQDDEIFGMTVKKPNYDSLTGGETVFVLTENSEANAEINEKLKVKGITNIISLMRGSEYVKDAIHNEILRLYPEWVKFIFANAQ